MLSKYTENYIFAISWSPGLHLLTRKKNTLTLYTILIGYTQVVENSKEIFKVGGTA